MNYRKKLMIFLSLMFVLLIGFPSPVYAALSPEVRADEIKIGDNFVLGEDQTYEGNLFILGGTVTLERNSTLNENLILLGANLDVSGTINGDIITLGGVVDINEQGTVMGDINSAGAFLDIDPAANIKGDINTETSGSFWTQLPAGVRVPRMDLSVNPFVEILWFIFRTLLWALLAILTVMFLPRPTERVTRAVVSEPWLSGGLGLLTLAIAPIILIMLSITIILIPITLIVIIALIIAWAFGIISIGLELGNRFAKVVNQTWHPALSAGIGTFGLVLVINGLDALVLCLGLIPKLIFGILGLGSVLITFFGTRDLPVKQATYPTVQTIGDSQTAQSKDTLTNEQE